MSDIIIKQATEDDILALYDLYKQIGQQDEGYFEACFAKDCLILMALIEKNTSNSTERSDDCGLDKEVVGFGVLNFEPKYILYKKLEIPEIQDLNVIPEARQQGIGMMLVGAFENIARDQGAGQLGISVGLTKSYGPAQRLYTKLGYIPDGCGITYDREGVTAGDRYPVDDDLCLMMVKDL